MFWLWLVLGVVVGCGILMFVAGSLLPRNHVATSTVTLKAGPAAVWAAITDWRALSKWRKEVTAVEELPTKDGWIETSRFGRVPLRVERSEPERLFVTRIADDKLPFGGTWTWKLEPAPGGGTRLAMTEDGFVGPPPFRLLAKYVFGHHRTLNHYQRALAAKFGEAAAPINS